MQTVYFFRFRDSRFFENDKWHVGMARPYPSDGLPRIGGRRTFSRFKELDEKPLTEHVKDYVGEDEDGV